VPYRSRQLGTPLKTDTSFANMRYNTLRPKQHIICRWQFTNLQVPLGELCSIRIFLSKRMYRPCCLQASFDFYVALSLPASRDAKSVMEGTPTKCTFFKSKMDFPSNHHIIMLSCRWKLSSSVIRYVALCASDPTPSIHFKSSKT
jgi:hypothetical protein